MSKMIVFSSKANFERGLINNDKRLRESTALLTVDVQGKLIRHENLAAEVLLSIQKIIKEFQIPSPPIALKEQDPLGLGSTVSNLKCLLGDKQCSRNLKKSVN